MTHQTPIFFPFGKKRSASGQKTAEGIFLPVNRRLGKCMTHRSDIVWIEASKKKEEIEEIIGAHPEFREFPVCAGTVDSVLGVLSAGLFFAALTKPLWPGLKTLVKKPVYLPETVTILKTLSMLNEADCRMAFIIDEYGGIEGIVTRNGLVSELLEEVEDESASSDPEIFRRDDGSFLVDGQIRMDEIRELFSFPDANSASHDYYTLAGYLLSVHGNIPKTGDRIKAGNYQCEIVDMDGHRIDKVLITADPAGQ
jgi:putative hemolysin